MVNVSKSMFQKRSLRPTRLNRFVPGIESLEQREVLSGQPIEVTTFADVTDADDGVRSLREAIAEAALSEGDDTIQLASGTYALDAGELFINDSSGKLTIEAPEGAVLDAQGASRVVDIFESDVELNKLTVTGGVDQEAAGIRVSNSVVAITNGQIRNNAASIQYGGLAVFEGSNVTLNNTQVSDNTVSGTAFGTGCGGIAARDGGSVVLNNTVVSDNSAGFAAGGICVGFGGSAVLNNSTVNNNTAGQLAGGMVVTAGASVVLNHSVVSNNSAGDSGGGIVGSNAGGVGPINTIELNSSQVSGNEALIGGGFALGEGVNSLVLNDSAVTDNMSTGPSPFGDGFGGGILMHSLGSHSVELYGTEISGNSAVGSGGGIQMNGMLTVGSNTRIFGNESGDLSGDSQLSSLHVDSDGEIATDAFGESLSAVRDVTIEGTLLATVNSATTPLEATSTLTLAPGSLLRLEASGKLGSLGKHKLTIAESRSIHGLFDTTPPIGEHLGYGVFVADIGDSGSAVSYANNQVSMNLYQAGPGDVNADGVFNSADLIQVLQAGEYKDGISNNSTFVEGDWNHDGDFDNEDIVLALQQGSYAANATAASRSPAAAIDVVFGQDE